MLCIAIFNYFCTLSWLLRHSLQVHKKLLHTSLYFYIPLRIFVLQLCSGVGSIQEAGYERKVLWYLENVWNMITKLLCWHCRVFYKSFWEAAIVALWFFSLFKIYILTENLLKNIISLMKLLIFHAGEVTTFSKEGYGINFLQYKK